MNKITNILMLLIFMALCTPEVCAQFHIDNTKSTSVEVAEQKYNEKLTKKILKEWKKKNKKNVSETEILKITSGISKTTAPRYIATSQKVDGERVFNLKLKESPVGYLELHYNNISLGWAMVGDNGNIYVHASKTPDILSDTDKPASNAARIRQIINDNPAYTVAGIDKEGLLFYEQDNKLMAIDIEDFVAKQITQDQLPEKSVYDNRRHVKNKPLLYTLTSLGGAAAVAILVICAVH